MTNQMAETWRHLSEETDDAEFAQASLVAQLFSGVAFTALVMYLVFSNSTRQSYIQKASLEKRLHFCCQLNTIVAALSAFLNLFQLTEVDNWVLPGQRSMTIDMARPIEWILTCPLMQLSLVIMGGSRIPEYRRSLMPGLAATVLAFGSSTLFVDTPWVFVLFGCGLSTHGVAMYFNRLQIIEHSKGVEGLLEGDSEFRKATLILISTWLPFPTWYILSPEGVGVITSISVIQLGWAFLNITSKFSLIFYMQRIKDNYCNRLKVKRELKGAFSSNQYGEDEEEGKEISGELSACVVETMSDLGMAYNVERFLLLLREAGVYNLDDIEKLDNKEECARKQLPLDLVSAIQRKHKVWALEMVDDAERGLEASEKHYQVPVPGGKNYKAKKTRPGEGLFISPSNVVPCEAIALQPNQPLQAEFTTQVCGPTNGQPDMRRQQSFRTEALTPYQSGPLASDDHEVLKKMEQLEDKMMNKFNEVMQSLQKKMEKQLEKTELSQKSVEAKVEFALSTQQRGSAAMENSLTEKMERTLRQMEASSRLGDDTQAQAVKAAEQSLDVVTKKMEESLDVVTKNMEEFKDANKAELSRLGGSMAQMMDNWAQHTIQESKAVAYTLQTKMAQSEEIHSKKTADMEANITAGVQRLAKDVVDNVRTTTTQQTKTSFDQLQRSVESTQSINIDELSKFEQKMVQFVKGLNQDFSKNVELGLGVVGNSLRAQLEGIQSSSMMNHHKTETTISHKVDSSLNGMQTKLLQGLSQQSQQLASQAQTESQKQMDKSMDQITGLVQSCQMNIQSNRQDTEETSNAMHDVISNTDELMGKLATLYDHLGVNDCDLDRPNTHGVASPSSNHGGRRSRGASDHQDRSFNRQLSTGSRR